MLRLFLAVAALAAPLALGACESSSSSDPALQPKPTEQRTTTPQVPAPPSR